MAIGALARHMHAFTGSQLCQADVFSCTALAVALAAAAAQPEPNNQGLCNSIVCSAAQTCSLVLPVNCHLSSHDDRFKVVYVIRLSDTSVHSCQQSGL